MLEINSSLYKSFIQPNKIATKSTPITMFNNDLLKNIPSACVDLYRYYLHSIPNEPKEWHTYPSNKPAGVFGNLVF